MVQEFLNKFTLSIKNNLKGIILILIASIFTAVGQLFWKLSNGTNIMLLLIGFMCYGLGAVLMILAFRYGSLSVIHPMLSFGYIIAIFLGTTVLNEQITPLKLIAIAIIMVGVVLIGGGDV